MLILNVLLSTDITVRVVAVDASAAGEEYFITISYILLLLLNCICTVARFWNIDWLVNRANSYYVPLAQNRYYLNY